MKFKTNIRAIVIIPFPEITLYNEMGSLVSTAEQAAKCTLNEE